MKFYSLTILSVLSVLALTGCANKKNKQYAGIDGDYVSGTPLAERSEGVNFLGANVERGQYAPVQFAFDSSSIAQEQICKISAVANAIKSSTRTIIIAGFTDERGTQEYNRSLGERRALAVREALISQGIQANNIQTVSFGSEMPVDPANNEIAWAKNRRAEFGLAK